MLSRTPTGFSGGGGGRGDARYDGDARFGVHAVLALARCGCRDVGHPARLVSSRLGLARRWRLARRLGLAGGWGWHRRHCWMSPWGWRCGWW